MFRIGEKMKDIPYILLRRIPRQALEYGKWEVKGKYFTHRGFPFSPLAVPAGGDLCHARSGKGPREQGVRPPGAIVASPADIACRSRATVVKERDMPRCCILALCIVLVFSCGPSPSGRDGSPIDVLQPPAVEKQKPEIVRLSRDGYDITITRKAGYTVRGIVVGRENYHSGWNSLISPADVALCWGKIAENGTYRRLKWSQGNRWYFWRAGEDFGYSNDFIAGHSSNNHLIPATPNLEKAVKGLKEGDAVELAGHLVDVAATKQTRNYGWNSSMTTEDRGDGACEIIYLTRLKVHGKIYQ